MTSFDINKAITTSQFFSAVDLKPSSKLVLRCIVDFWNYKLGYAYPTIATIQKCCGLSDVSVSQAVAELKEKKIIRVKKKCRRYFYYFTQTFLAYILPESFSLDTPKILGEIPEDFYGNKNIYKKNKKEIFSFSNSLFSEDGEQAENIEAPAADDEKQKSKEMSPREFAEIFVKNLGHLSCYAEKAQKYREEFGL